MAKRKLGRDAERRERRRRRELGIIACRQRALGGEPHLMAIRFPDWHAHVLAEVALYSALQQVARKAPLAA